MDCLIRNGYLASSLQNKAMLLGVFGLALIILSVKLAFDLYASAQVEIDLNDKPALLYITDENPCDCAKRMIAEADYQIKNWSEPQRMEVPLIQISLGNHPDLEAKYDIFRAPTLILLDAREKIFHRQDYPLMGGRPFNLQEFEAKLEELGYPR
jgi:hypothetical protein